MEALLVLSVLLALVFGGKPKPKPKPAGGGGLLLILVVAVLAWGGTSSGAGAPAPQGSGDAGGLTPGMQAAVADLDAAMGGGLVIVSGYRSSADQARVCATTTLPCAPPGRSLHQKGLAVDIPRSQVPAAVAALRANPGIPLCHPFPQGDPVHFSHVTGGEC